MTSLSFDVVGTPGPQGSKAPKGRTKTGRTIMVESSKKVAPWRQDVAAAARAAHSGPPLDGPLELTVIFRFPATSSWRAADRARGWRWKDRTPDLDKLLRSTGDALQTAGVVADDARIVRTIASKVEIDGWTGARITLASVGVDADPEEPA